MTLSHGSLRRAVAVIATLATLAAGALAEGTLVSASARMDHVYNPADHILYITNGTQIVRYDVEKNARLTPIAMGVQLSGIDLSPDGTTLAVGDIDSSKDPHLFLIDVKSGTAKQVSFQADFLEYGTWSVAFADNDTVLVTTRFLGSGDVPFRRYHRSTDSYEVIGRKMQDTMLTPSADRSVIAFAESNTSDGPFGAYRSSDGVILTKSGYADGTAWFNYEIGVNRNATQYAIPTYGGTFITDANLVKTGQVIGQYAGAQPIGAAYDPYRDIVYCPMATTSNVVAYDTTTWSPIGTYDFEYGFSHPGNFAYNNGRIKVSRDGTLLAATVGGGVRFVRLAPPLFATSTRISIWEDAGGNLDLTASGGVGPYTYRVVSGPAHGTLLGTAPALDYVPSKDFFGTDSFTFEARDSKGQTALGTVTLDVTPINDPPVANPDSVTVRRGVATAIPVLKNDVDPDGDTLRIISFSRPRYGTVQLLANGTMRYCTSKTFTGADTFQYTIADPSGLTSTATVSVTLAH